MSLVGGTKSKEERNFRLGPWKQAAVPSWKLWQVMAFAGESWRDLGYPD